MEMHLKYTSLFLLSATLALLLVACGQPLPDIDATVEARVERTLAAAASIDATVEARVELALAAIPTPTPKVIVKEVVKEVIVEVPVEVVVEKEVVKEVLVEVVVEKEVVVEVPVEVVVEPVLAEDVFADIFQNATRVDRVSIDDIKDCRVVSSYDVKVGDIVSVEVALARREDLSSYEFNFRPYYSYIRDTSNDGILGNDAERTGGDFNLTTRIIGNPWNEANTGPGRISIYRERSSGPHDATEYTAIGDLIPDWGTLVPGTYTVGFVPNEKVSDGYSTPGDPNLAYCKQMQRSINVENLIPDSVLIAWYVN